ncbi:multiple cyclophane-containing RiPP AmcA [Streptomyces sp. NPDC050161]|uniref:multiple cyclophane-containing RiPP AmcA n=1 Tax=Streptomyces sp. NPDC050161 TaxID=3365604 RepID=UPI0037B4716C
MPIPSPTATDRIHASANALQALIDLTPDHPHLGLDSEFDNRSTWDNTTSTFDNRPTWDNWNKKR